MANNVAPPRNGIPIGTARISGQAVPVEVHPEYLRWFENLVFRLGGVTGPTATDLAASAFEDAGIEESKLDLFRLEDAAGQAAASLEIQSLIARASLNSSQAPPVLQIETENNISTELEHLRAQVAELTKAVKALQQGLTA
jgi:hypothetical protein